MLAGIAEELRTNTTTHAQLEVDPDAAELLNGDAKTIAGLLHIAREATTNVIRHADARPVDIRLTETRGGLQFTIADDGKGFLLSEDSTRSGLGLRNMTARARTLGGRLWVQTVPANGTKVQLTLPLAEGRRHDRATRALAHRR